MNDYSGCSSARQVAEKAKEYELEEKREQEDRNIRNASFAAIQEQNKLLTKQIENQNKLLNQREAELNSSRKLNIFMACIAVASLVVALVFGIIGILK